MTETNSSTKQIARFIVPSRFQVEQWGRSKGDISTTAVSARVEIEGRYSIAFPAPTSTEEAYSYNEMAEHIATLLNAHEASVVESANSAECLICGRSLRLGCTCPVVEVV